MDSDRTNRRTDDSDAATEIAHWIVITALCHPTLVAAKGKLSRELDSNEDVARLQRLGCDDHQLLNVLAFAEAMPSLYPSLHADTLRELATDLRKILRRMKFATPSIALPWIEECPDGTQTLTWQPTAGDLDLSPELEGKLQRRADAYEHMARLCRQRDIPSRATFRKFAYLWPIQYIRSRTGRAHYAAAARLLSFVGISKNEKQLKVAFLSVREQCPWVLSWMDLATTFLHGIPSLV